MDHKYLAKTNRIQTAAAADTLHCHADSLTKLIICPGFQIFIASPTAKHNLTLPLRTQHSSLCFSAQSKHCASLSPLASMWDFFTVTLLCFDWRCHAFVYTTHTFYLTRRHKSLRSAQDLFVSWFCFFWGGWVYACTPLVVQWGAATDFSELDLAFDFHTVYTMPHQNICKCYWCLFKSSIP